MSCGFFPALALVSRNKNRLIAAQTSIRSNRLK